MPRRAPYPRSQGTGDLTWEPSRLPGLEWAGKMPSAPLPLLLQSSGPLLSASPVLPSASILCPQDQCGWRVRGALEGRGPAWELSRFPGPEWEGQSPSALLPLLPEGLSRLPLLISLASGVPIQSGLHFCSLLSPPCLTGSLGGSSLLLGCQRPPPVAGRHLSCGEMLTQRLPTPPSFETPLLKGAHKISHTLISRAETVI